MKVKNSPIAIKYCENKGMPIAEFHDKFDKDLNILMGAIDRHGFVFWACPNGCNDLVDWNDVYKTLGFRCLQTTEWRDLSKEVNKIIGNKYENEDLLKSTDNVSHQYFKFLFPRRK